MIDDAAIVKSVEQSWQGCPSHEEPDVRVLLGRLVRAYGPQAWWPADSRFEIMAGAVLVQRTSWRNAAAAIANLKAHSLMSSRALAGIRRERLERLIRSAGFFRVKARRVIAIARFVEGGGGIERLSGLADAELRGQLLDVHGIGEETADAILLYAFDRPVWVSDAYSRRILSRLDPSIDDVAAERRFVRALIDDGDVAGLGEFHALIVEHGKRRCGAVPRCDECPLRQMCEFGGGRSWS